MFSWLKSSPLPPPRVAANPGRGTSVRIGFSNARGTWEEEDDLVASLARVLVSLGHKARARRGWVELDGGFTLVPQWVDITPEGRSGVRIASTIQVAHPDLVPGGVFEYQHTGGNDVKLAFANGFSSWAQIDLPVFLDAMLEKPANSLFLEMKQDTAKLELTCDRRVVLGPTQHLAQRTASEPQDECHPFCPCCLFTNSLDAMRGLIAADEFFGIRLFVTRDANGECQADCRVNGVDFAPAIAPLIEYANQWPDRGLEWRKQYAVIRSMH